MMMQWRRLRFSRGGNIGDGKERRMICSHHLFGEEVSCILDWGHNPVSCSDGQVQDVPWLVWLPM
eukprot:767231-Hanusia_phi.AAC.1